MKKNIKYLFFIICCMSLVLFFPQKVFAGTSSAWSWPTSIHTIKNDWPNYSSGSYHGGTDFPVALNSPVYSTCDGEVVAVTSLTTSYGKHIKIRAVVNGETVYIRYCHLNSFAVNVGDKVQSGQLIAYSGSTGNSTGPHLHYEVRNANDTYKPNLNLFFASTFSSKMQIDFLKVAWGISPVLHFPFRHSFRCRRGAVAGIQSLLVTDM